jgi:hypothetical protein
MRLISKNESLPLTLWGDLDGKTVEEIATAAMYRFNRHERKVRGKEAAKLSYHTLPDGSIMIGRIE